MKRTTVDWTPQHQAVLEAFGPKADGQGTEAFRSQLTDKQAEFLEGVGNPNIMASERSTHIDKFLGSLTEPQKAMLDTMARTQDLAARNVIDSAAPPVQNARVENKPAPPTPAVKPEAPMQPSGGIGEKSVEVAIRPETVLGQEPLKDTAGEVIALEGGDKSKVSVRATADPSEVVMSVGGEERTVKKNDLGINDMEALKKLSKESADLNALKQLDAEGKQVASAQQNPATPAAPANTAPASAAAALMNGSGNQISMRGDKVTQLQTLLAQDPELAKAMTYEKDGQAVVVDGLAGARTRGAVETYAAENNLNLNTMSVDDLIAHAQNNAALKVSVSADVSDTEVSQTAPASDGPPVWAEKIEAGSVDGTAPVAGAEYYTAAATQEKITSNFNTESSPEPKTPEPVPGQRWDAGMTPLERTLAANNTP